MSRFPRVGGGFFVLSAEAILGRGSVIGRRS